MNKILITTILSVLVLTSFASAALGIGSPKELNQEKEIKRWSFPVYTFGNDAVQQGKFEVIGGKECITAVSDNILFNSQGTAYAEIEVDTTKSECKDSFEGKVRLSPVNPTSSSTGTVGMNLAVAKSFDVVVPATSTVAIVALVVLLIAIMLLIGAMFRIAKRRSYN